MSAIRLLLVASVIFVAEVRAADESESLRAVTGFAIKVDPIDADGAEMGLFREAVASAVELTLRSKGMTVFSTEQVVDGKTGVGHPGVLSVRVAVEKMPVGFAGFVQLRVFQEALLRQGTYTVASTWHRDGQFTALSADRGRRLVAELIDEALEGLAANHKAANARSLQPIIGSPLNCRRWSIQGVRPSDDWPIAMAILRDPPDPKWSAESAYTRMANWKVSTPLQSSVGLAVFGVRTETEPWTVALVSSSYRAPVSFEDVVESQRRAWGEPSKCGPEVKRFGFETQGCFWQDAWCDTWAMVTEAANTKSVAVVLGSFEGWSRYQAFIKAEEAGRKNGRSEDTSVPRSDSRQEGRKN